MEKTMTVILWIVGGLVAFVLVYKLLNRKDFKIINYLKQKIGCTEAVAHNFVAFYMPAQIGLQGWSRLRGDMISDPEKLDLVILPLFVDWFLGQSANEEIYNINKEIIEKCLSNTGLTLSDIERRLGMAISIADVYKVRNY